MEPFKGTSVDWNAAVASLPLAHLLQTWEWSQVKAKFGWQAYPFTWGGSSPQAAAMVLKRAIPVRGFAKRMCVLYVPKGPCLDWRDEVLLSRVLEDLQSFARDQGAIFIKIDGDIPLGTGIPGAVQSEEDASGLRVQREMQERGWRFSNDQIQFRNTVMIDLSPDEEHLLAGMKQKMRYNVRLAERKGVSVRPGRLEDAGLLYRMYAETSVRDGFLIRGEDYYQTVWRTFTHGLPGSPQPEAAFSEPLVAEVEGEVVAAISVFYFARQALYLFGMSRQAHREKMPNSLLQWEAMKRARAFGCTQYNLWGAPEVFDESDSLWSVFRFKEGLGGTVLRTLGAWDYTPNPSLYRLYTGVLPRVMDLMRARGKAKTRQLMGT